MVAISTAQRRVALIMQEQKGMAVSQWIYKTRWIWSMGRSVSAPALNQQPRMGSSFDIRELFLSYD